MDMQKEANKCTKKFLAKAESLNITPEDIPTDAIKRYCRMLIIYCDTEGKVTKGFEESMDKCSKEILAISGMAEVFEACNVCPG